MELEKNKASFLGIDIIYGFWFDSVPESTDTGLLLQYHSHMDTTYLYTCKWSLLNINLNSVLNSHLPGGVFKMNVNSLKGLPNCTTLKIRGRYGLPARTFCGQYRVRTL